MPRLGPCGTIASRAAPFRPWISRAPTRIPKWRPISTEPAPSAHRSPVTPRRKISLRPAIWATVFVAIGLLAGHEVRLALAPPPEPEPGSDSDNALLASLDRDIDALRIVKDLRAEADRAQYHLRSDTPLVFPTDAPLKERDEHFGWREIPAVAFRARPDDSEGGEGGRTLTRDSMAGMRGLGVQRAFWNTATRELLMVLWMGSALTGWPGMAHGGAIATVFSEGLTRAAIGPDALLDSTPEPASLSLTYFSPTLAKNFYVMRAAISADPARSSSSSGRISTAKDARLPSGDLAKNQLADGSGKPVDGRVIEVSGTLETLEGKVCVKAKATWPWEQIAKTGQDNSILSGNEASPCTFWRRWWGTT